MSETKKTEFYSWRKHDIDFTEKTAIKKLYRKYPPIWVLGLLITASDYLFRHQFIKRNIDGAEEILASCGDITTDPQEVLNFFEDVVKSGYFEIDNDCFICPDILKNYQKKLAISEARSNARKQQDEPEPEPEPGPKAKKTKPAGESESKPKEQAPPPVESPEVKELFEYIDTILANYPNAKYAKRELAADDAQKVINKYGMRDAKDLCNISYSWKAGRVEKPKSSDYGRLFRKGWVHEELEKEREKNEGNGNGKPSYNQSAQSNTYQSAGMITEKPPYEKYLPDDFNTLDYDGQAKARNEAYMKWKTEQSKDVANGRN